MKLLFTGDISFRGQEFLTYEKSRTILSEVQPYLDAVDFRIPNLECPLANVKKYHPIKKSGPNLIYEPSNVCFLKAVNADAVTLANNHIGDYGEGAVIDTLTLLDDNNILHSGAGSNIYDAYKAFRLSKDGVKVSVISVCENEFGMATETTYGSSGYNQRMILKQIKEEKNVSDYVVVVFHGGNEFNPLPSPDTVDRYRLVCDMGADAVIGGHTHCPQGYEIYQGKPIVYSMGNFIFKSSTPRDEFDSWHYGYMSLLNIDDGISLEVIPYKFDTDATKITVFDGESKVKMINYLNELSRIIQSPQELASYFMGWCWNHKWIPKLPLDTENVEKTYNSSSSYDLALCESHYSQMKEVFRILYADETEKAKIWSEKIVELTKMPI